MPYKTTNLCGIKGNIVWILFDIVFNIKGVLAKKESVVKVGDKYQITLQVPVFETLGELDLLAIIPAKDDDEKNKVIGAAKIIPVKAFDDPINIAIVPVNDAVIASDISNRLNQIYKNAGVKFNVNVLPSYKVDKKTLDCGTDALLDKYSAEQSDFIGQYKKENEIDRKQYYVFVTKDIVPSRAIAGFMPRHAQFGFVFADQSQGKVTANSDQATTIAHELGHGIFELEHPWEQYKTGNQNSNTPWLMDYNQGTQLPYTHWQRISHPKFGLYFLDKSEKGEQITAGYNYLMPNHQPFRFQKEDGKLNSDCIIITSANNGNFPNGTLYAFSINGKDYHFIKDGFYTKGIAIPYKNAYNSVNAKEKFRLVIQQVGNSCNYALAVRKTINFDNPNLTIQPTDVFNKAKNCNKIPLSNEKLSNTNSNEILNVLAKIKKAVYLDVNISSSDLPKIVNAVAEKNVTLEGMKYDFIQMEIQNTNQEVHPKGKITRIQRKNMYAALYGLDIDGKIQIYVDKEQVEFIYNYLMDLKSDNFILFVNGYDPVKMADDTNEVFEYDKLDYWGTIDDKFAMAINSKSHLIYADGDKGIDTSNHENTCKFVKSLTSVEKEYALVINILGRLGGEFSTAAAGECATAVFKQSYHNKAPNIDGFENRKKAGRMAGENFINKLKNGSINCSKTMKDGKTTINGVVDIVAHSMGFAYSLGMIEVLQKEGVAIGNYYILAPENACSGALPDNIKDRTWQYGSNEKEDPIEIQDGVAPQCAIEGINPLNRIYIPIKDRKPEQLGFIPSHSIQNYEWIFSTIAKGTRGYVIPRN